MDTQIFVDLGMTKTEAEIFIEILKLKETLIGSLIKRTGMHRGTVYNSVNNLIKKGFVCFSDRSGKRYYKYSGEKIFETVIDEKERKLEEEKKEINNFLKEISKISGEVSNKVQVFYGVEAFKMLFLEIYEECKKNNCEYLFLGRGGEMQDAAGESFYKYTQKLKKKLKVKCRVILDKQTTSHPYHKVIEGNLKYIPSKIYSPVNFWIYQDTILLVLFGGLPLVSIKIKSKDLADGFRNYFEYLWKMAKK
ncbi:MAG: helix-turn-helix domain-containing protein [archaeon]